MKLHQQFCQIQILCKKLSQTAKFIIKNANRERTMKCMKITFDKVKYSKTIRYINCTMKLNEKPQICIRTMKNCRKSETFCGLCSWHFH